MQEIGASAIIARIAWFNYLDVEHSGGTTPAHAALDGQAIIALNVADEAVLSATAQFVEGYGENLEYRSPAELLDEALKQAPKAKGFLRKCRRRYLEPLEGRAEAPVQSMASHAMAVCIQEYESRGFTIREDLPGRVRFDTLLLKEMPQGSMDPHFNGVAKVISATEDITSADVLCTIQLQLSPVHFDRTTFGALPYVLFHEILSHVLQGPLRRDREVPSSASEFAEGWMDEAAWLVLQAQLSKPSTTRDLLACPFRVDVFRHGGSRLYLAKSEVVSDYKLRSTRARIVLGKRAASDVISAFDEMEPGKGVENFLNLSFAINSSDLPPAERDQVVNDLAALVAQSQRQLSTRTLAMRSLHDWTQHRRLEALIEMVRHFAEGESRRRSGPLKNPSRKNRLT